MTWQQVVFLDSSKLLFLSLKKVSQLYISIQWLLYAFHFLHRAVKLCTRQCYFMIGTYIAFSVSATCDHAYIYRWHHQCPFDGYMKFTPAVKVIQLKSRMLWFANDALLSVLPGFTGFAAFNAISPFCYAKATCRITKKHYLSVLRNLV